MAENNGARLPRLLAVVGPTASGKSALAMRLAARYGGEIVCCDSMQIYRRMDIGTAKPTAEERALIPHHMVDFTDPTAGYSCAEYAADAAAAAYDILARGGLPVVCGGTGLYLDALLFRRPFDESGRRTGIRSRLEAEAAAEGGAHRLYLRLCETDPESAAKTHENNIRRVIRALEIYEETGIPKSRLDRMGGEARFDSLVIGIRYPDRAELNARIEARVDAMLAAGLADETAALEAAGVFERNLTAAQAIGYKEILGYIHGECSPGQAREALIVATRRYAKRQMTWFGSRGYVRWIDAGGNLPDPYDTALCLTDAWLGSK